MNTVVWVESSILSHFMTEAFVSLGVPRNEAAFCAEVIIEADKRGIESHGIGRFKSYYYDRVKSGIQSAKTSVEIVRETPTTAVIDGHNGMGHIVAKKSMELAIKKAKKVGMGMVAVRNSTHYGIAAHYTNMALPYDMIGISGTNTRPGVAPTFGVENVIGTNPLSFSMPTDEGVPFVMDASTAVAQLGKISAFSRGHKSLPEGWVIDRKGKTCTDPHLAHEGLTHGTMALVPLGGIGEEGSGHKGYGFATVVEILSAALSGGSFLSMLSGIKDGKKVPIPVSHFFLAIDIKAFIEPSDFKKITGDILRTLRFSKKMPGHNRIYTAGEKEYEMYKKREKTGIPVRRATQHELLDIQAEAKLHAYHFPFTE